MSTLNTRSYSVIAQTDIFRYSFSPQQPEVGKASRSCLLRISLQGESEREEACA